MSAGEDPHENPLKVCRRLVYLHRLVGDDVLTPKAKTTRPNPWRVSIVFAFYTLCATWSILSFIDVGFLNSINTCIKDALLRPPYDVKDGLPLTVEDITTVHDISSYLSRALFPQMLLGRMFSEPGSISTFNRVYGRPGFCEKVSVILLTMRKIKKAPSQNTATTARFSALYPETWAAGAPGAGAATNAYEDTSDIWGEFSQPSDKVNTIALDKMGYADRQGKNLTQEHFEHASSDNVSIQVKWKYSKPCTGQSCSYNGGYQNAGGFVAAAVIQSSKEHAGLLKLMEERGNVINWAELLPVAKGFYIHLLDPEGTASLDKEVGACADGVKSTNIMRLEDFFEAGFFDEFTTSISASFYTYNANQQTCSEVALNWMMHSSGIVLKPMDIQVHTIKLDLADTYIMVLELVYILGTAFYFIELFVYKLYKKSYKLFHEIWTWINTFSIIASVLSVTIRFQCTALNKSFLLESEGFNFERNDITDGLVAQKNLLYLYQVTSAIALVTIWLRIVELLAKTPPRVKLLESTLVKAIAAMVVYFCYIMVIVSGFWAFSAVHFAEFSWNFASPMRAFISCFEMLCLNIAPYNTTSGAPLRVFFLFPYFLFSIISVQMFNSIINYAYNRVSEDMEPIFKKALRDKKNNAKKDNGPLKQFLGGVKIVCDVLRRKCCKKKKMSADAGNSEDKKPVKDKEAAPSLEELAPNDKELVEGYTAKGAKKQEKENTFAMCLYAIFAVSYLLFLHLALRVDRTAMISAGISDDIFDTQVLTVNPSGSQSFTRFHDISSIYGISHWLSHALPDIIKEIAPLTDTAHNSFYEGRPCFRNWNCLVTGSDMNSSIPKMVRITQRVFKRIPNTGLVGHDPPHPLTDERFSAGHRLLPSRLPKQDLDILSAPDPTLENTTSEMNIYFEDRLFCRRDQAGGYASNGGIVCMLDADPLNMTKQLAIMTKEGYFSLDTAVILVEMLTYNGNSDTLCHVRLQFTHKVSGCIVPKGDIFAFGLLGAQATKAGDHVAQRMTNTIISLVTNLDMIFGLVYMSLVMKFVFDMLKEIRQECSRKLFNDGKRYYQTVVEYFVDSFHCLDAVSYVISILSFVFFLMWLNTQMDLSLEKEGDLSEFFTYIFGLLSKRKLYSTLSIFNLLIMFVRPLKFARNDPRMAKLNMTFFLAMSDIIWFNVILLIFLMGFVMFAHIMFGIQLAALSDVLSALIYCFKFLIGAFDFWELWVVSQWAAICFVFSFLFLFKFFFLNVFFAIIDKFFVSGETPPVNPRKLLKPVFGRLCRWIEWDRDHTMEGDGIKADDGPLSRAAKVQKFANEIQAIRDAAMNAGEEKGAMKKSKALSDVCEPDERMNDVLRWSRDEAKAFVDQYRHMQLDKAEFRNDEVFLKTKVKKSIDKELENAKETMHEAERHQRYAIMVNESLAKRDQEILSKYIMRLEQKIEQNLRDRHALETDVFHLKAESHKMRYTDEEMKHLSEGDAAQPQSQDALRDAASAAQSGAPAGAPDEEEADEAPSEDGQKKDEDAGDTQGTTHADLHLALQE